MRVLLDTNIIIHREAVSVINQDIGTLFNWLDKLSVEKCVHPLSIEEIKNHKNPKVVETMLIKISSYSCLKTIAKDSSEILEIRAKEDKNRNDEIDTSMLSEVFADRVDALISEDRGIHRKALLLGIDDRVFTIDTYLEKVSIENPGLKDYEVLAVKKEYFGNINYEDPFFDSFKRDYREFEKWFNRKADSLAYVCFVDDAVKAFLYLKIETSKERYDDIEPRLPEKKRLKIGTFKVVSTGLKLGERFLKIIIDNALAHRVEEVYVTVFRKRPEQVRLINLLMDWGFSEWGFKQTDNGTEVVLVKDLNPSVNVSQPKLSYPFASRKTRKFIVPIRPEYHTDLLPDSRLSNESPQGFVESEPYRNAIQKAYISRSYERGLKSGDVIIFYRTKDNGPAWYTSVVTTIGVVENVIDGIESEEKFVLGCRRRSVFDDEELQKHWRYTYPNGKWVAPFIVNFLYLSTMPMPRLNLKKLTELGVLNKPPRGFEPIDDDKFELLLKAADTDESYFVD